MVFVRVHSLRSACATSAVLRLVRATRPQAGGAPLVLGHVVRRCARSKVPGRVVLSAAQGCGSFLSLGRAVCSGTLAANPSINRTPKKLRFLCAGYVKR